MSTILSLITGVMSAVQSVFSWLTKRSDLNNTPQMQENKIAKQDQEYADGTNKDIAKKDDDSMRNRLS